VVGSTFNVWYRLAEELSKLNDSDLNAVFRPYVEKLFLELAKHCQIDEDTSQVRVREGGVKWHLDQATPGA